MAARRKRLGELVLRSENPRALVEFYQDVIGLEKYAALGSATFLKVDDDFEGHPQLLAIFQKAHTYSGPRNIQTEVADARAGTLHHFAFALDLKDFEAEQERLQGIGAEFEVAQHPQFGWRSLYLFDPDGNSVELVCYDASALDQEANLRARGGMDGMDRMDA